MGEKYMKYQSNILTLSRYINNLFLIWDGTSDLLLEFFSCLKNEFHLTFTLQYDTHYVSFQVDPTGKIVRYLFRKPSAGNTVLKIQ